AGWGAGSASSRMPPAADERLPVGRVVVEQVQDCGSDFGRLDEPAAWIDPGHGQDGLVERLTRLRRNVARGVPDEVRPGIAGTDRVQRDAPAGDLSRQSAREADERVLRGRVRRGGGR